MNTHTAAPAACPETLTGAHAWEPYTAAAGRYCPACGLDEPAAIEYAHPQDIGRTSGMGDPITCYHANAAAAAAQGKGIPRYTGAGCDREHVEIHTPLTYPAAVSARYAGDAYAAYIQRDLARKLAQGLDRTGDSLGALFIGNDGE